LLNCLQLCKDVKTDLKSLTTFNCRSSQLDNHSLRFTIYDKSLRSLAIDRRHPEADFHQTTHHRGKI